MSESEESTEQPPDRDGPDPEAVLAEVTAHDEELAEDIATLLDRIPELEGELESLESELETARERLERTRADFKNYKERAKRQQAEIKDRAAEDLVERLLEVRDNLGRALSDESGAADSLREGVELTRKQFDQVLADENVTRIEPEAGGEIDANKHEVMMRVESDEPEDTIASVYRPGYEMGGKILRPAQVTVSDGAEGTDSEPEDESSEQTAD